ncbi:hypothetical protein [Microvirga sp. VF16]|uniref:AbiU2 domain-containing protein n=1 Tax=Microvirga sp. VF16 TaxID=2807101 RepID=UPI00193D3ED8|nr:hypothetical protein [Microvirga sp. VF16]QRM28383.1 hypothetical protein JO965_19400 [Microvirga sp. VF16]
MSKKSIRVNPLQAIAALSPLERINISLTHLDHAHRLLHEAINYSEQRRAILPTLAEFWHDNMPRPVFTLLVTVTNFEVSSVCRLWDKAALPKFGLPTIAALLDDPNVLEIVEEQLSTTHQSAEVLRSELSRIDEAISTIKEIEASDQIMRVRNFRDKFIAHPLLWTYNDQKAAIELIKDGDTDALVVAAISTMTRLMSVARGEPLDYLHLQEREREESKRFFDSVKWPSDKGSLA